MARLSPEHVADMAIHCSLAGAFVGLVVAALTLAAFAQARPDIGRKFVEGG